MFADAQDDSESDLDCYGYTPIGSSMSRVLTEARKAVFTTTLWRVSWAGCCVVFARSARGVDFNMATHWELQLQSGRLDVRLLVDGARGR